jgi:hypothetical protein
MIVDWTVDLNSRLWYPASSFRSQLDPTLDLNNTEVFNFFLNLKRKNLVGVSTSFSGS